MNIEPTSGRQESFDIEETTRLISLFRSENPEDSFSLKILNMNYS